MSNYKTITCYISITILLLLTSCASNNIIDEASIVDNNERNLMYNDGNNLLRTDDSLFYRKLIRKTNYINMTSELFQEIYRIDNKSITKVYSKKSQGENNWNFYPNLYIYNNELLDGNTHHSKKAGVTEIHRLNPTTQQFEKYIEITSPDHCYFYRFFTLNNELYLCSESEDGNIYKYKDGSCSLVYSQSYLQTYNHDFFNNFMYYTLSETDFNRYINVYKYDLNTQKTLGKLDFSGLKEIYNKPKYAANKICLLDNYLYVDYTENGQSDGVHHFYRLDISNNTFAELYNGEKSFYLNGYGENAYLGFPDEDNAGLYLATPYTDSLVKLCSKDVSSIFIVDDKWIYFSDINDALYRILPNGENLEKIL